MLFMEINSLEPLQAAVVSAPFVCFAHNCKYKHSIVQNTENSKVIQVMRKG